MEFDKQFGNNRAVSPVVGVILMVAITVILAAVIGTFVLDLGSDQTAPARAGLSAEITDMEAGDGQEVWDEDEADNDNNNAGKEIEITVADLGNAESFGIQVADNDGSKYYDGTSYVAYEPAVDDESASSVGDGMRVDELTEGDTVTVTATNNGESNVIQTYEI